MGSISKFIQVVFNAYTQSFNKVTGHSGTMFQGRCKGIEIDSDEYFIHLCRYIHRNPVDAKLTDSLKDWPHSDYREWIDATMDNNEKMMLRKKYFESAEEYEKFVSEYRDGAILDKYFLDV